jgi:hypothetical protein
MNLIEWMFGTDLEPKVYTQQISPTTAVMVTIFRQVVIFYPIYALITYITS